MESGIQRAVLQTIDRVPHPSILGVFLGATTQCTGIGTVNSRSFGPRKRDTRTFLDLENATRPRMTPRMCQMTTYSYRTDHHYYSDAF